MHDHLGLDFGSQAPSQEQPPTSTSTAVSTETSQPRAGGAHQAVAPPDEQAALIAALQARIAELEARQQAQAPQSQQPTQQVLYSDSATVELARAAAAKEGGKKKLGEIVPGFKANPLELRKSFLFI